MHPILFRIPLPDYNLPLVWIPLAIAIIAAMVAIAKMVGKEKDRQGAGIAALVAVGGVVARYVFLRDYSETWNVGHIPIYSYGVMLGLSLVVGWYLTLGLAERDGLPKETMANNYVVTAIAAVAGARILYILTNLNEFDSVASLFAMRRGGLVAYGGFLGGLAGSYFFLRSHKLPLLPWADVAVPSLASGLMITRIGCYMFGCDFGQPLTESAPGWLKKLGTFPHWPEGTLDHGEGAPAWIQHVNTRGLSKAAAASLPVHPTQLYESLLGAMLLLLLLWARRHQKFRGQIFFLFAFAYGTGRYLLEILRDDAERGSLPPALPEHILIPLGLGILAVGWVIGFSQAIGSVPLRRVTQVLAFAPVVGLYFVLKPESFATAATAQWSTSQFIGITSGFAASVAFAIFYKAALAHPREAMDLRLPPEFGGPVPVPAEGPDDDDEEEPLPVPKPVAKKKKGKLKSKAKPKPKPVVDEGAEEPAEKDEPTEKAEDEKKPEGEKKPEDEKKPEAKEPAGDEGDDPEPAKAG